jgi:DNA replicative helicase MCM subunit Mcm2 (Cdc46/Mcm family)
MYEDLEPDSEEERRIADEAAYTCDSCGEEIVVPLDCSAGSHQQYVEDCPVCCNPNVISVELDEDGRARVWSRPEQDRI